MRRLWFEARSVWHALRQPDRLNADINEEMRFHLEMETGRLIRERNLDPAEAARQARIAFGGVENFKEQAREARGAQWFPTLALDARLGVRMLRKYPALSVVGGFAIALAIAIGATGFEVFTEVLSSALPIADGSRVVSLRYETGRSGSPERRIVRDFYRWRQDLKSVELLSAFRTVQQNLTVGNAPAGTVKLAEMTASGFDVAGVPALLGRRVIPADEREGAPAVVVLGYQVWRSRFGGDPAIVGRTIGLGGIPHVIVGVMPVGFEFPVNHEFWIPLRANVGQSGALAGPAIYVFGRLAPGLTIERAQAELTAVGNHAAAENPAAYSRMRPVVLPYTREHLDLSDPNIVLLVQAARLLVGALAFVVAVNLAILFYARTVSRLGEIAIRTALGASRSRILIQLFVEAAALSVAGGVVGLILAQMALNRIRTLAVENGAVPFWLDFRLSAVAAAYACVLALLGALIMGVLPGLKATSSSLNANLREFYASGGARLGPMWSALVVAQVGIAVAVLPFAVFISWQVGRSEIAGPGFAADSFFAGGIGAMGVNSAADVSRTRRDPLELGSRLRSDPRVSSVSFSSSVPGFAPGARVEFEGGARSTRPGRFDVSTLQVSVNLMEDYGAPILAGRHFNAADPHGTQSVIVNRAFVRGLLQGGTALGLRFHYVRQTGESPDEEVRPRWYEIVGVVADFPAFPSFPGADGEPTVYHPAEPAEIYPVTLSVRFKGAVPDGFTDRFRRICTEVDPLMPVSRAMPLSTFYGEVRAIWRTLAWSIGLVTVAVLLLSSAGIHALTSYSVARRTREIGIRAALGASRRMLLMQILGRAVRHLATGLLAGSLVSGVVLLIAGAAVAWAIVVLAFVAGIMLLIGSLAAFGPARRGLRIQPFEALRTDACR